jgi:hypothetical protein
LGVSEKIWNITTIRTIDVVELVSQELQWPSQRTARQLREGGKSVMEADITGLLKPQLTKKIDTIVDFVDA